MEQYIDKDALVAEIERMKVDAIQFPFEEYGTVGTCNKLFSFLDTLETKEVNFEKEFDNYANGILACDVQFEPFTHLHKCAKYFFELGLKTQKGE